MKKIIDHVVNYPNGGETSRFPASFASAWMRIEGITSSVQVERWRFCERMTSADECCGRCGGAKEVNWLSKYHERVHNLYAVVSGISLMQLDLSNEEHLTPWWGPNTNRLLDEYDDYIAFTMGFAGYAYERFDKQADKAKVFDAVKRSIDTDRPVMMNFGPYYDWFAVTGYDDEAGRLYGCDGSQGYWGPFPAAEGYENELFYMSRWYEEMTEAVVITGKTTPSVTYDDVFQRMIRILETMLEKGDFKRSASYLRENANFENYDEEKCRQLAQRIDMFIGLPIDQRPVASWCFYRLTQVDALEDKWQFFKRIIELYDNTHDICFLAWRMVGASGTAPKEEVVKALASPIVRRAIADVIDIVRNNDELVLRCLREMMG